MKLPKNFGGQGFQGALAQAQQAMERAKFLEAELEAERLTVENGPVKAVFSGTGELKTLKIDPAAIDPEDVEALEDVIVAVVRSGFNQATELRAKKVNEIMPNIPGL